MNVTNLIMGIGSMVAGGKALKNAFESSSSTAIEDVGEVTHHNASSLEARIRILIDLIRKGREHPAIRAKTAQILSRKCADPKTGHKTWCIGERDWEGEVRAIFALVRDQVRYTRDTYGAELYQSPNRILQFGIGDCDDGVVVLASMLQSVGYPVKLRVTRSKGASDWDHIYLLVAVPPRKSARWVALDPSMNKPPGWQVPSHAISAKRDFLVT